MNREWSDFEKAIRNTALLIEKKSPAEQAEEWDRIEEQVERQREEMLFDESEELHRLIDEQRKLKPVYTIRWYGSLFYALSHSIRGKGCMRIFPKSGNKFFDYRMND